MESLAMTNKVEGNLFWMIKKKNYTISLLITMIHMLIIIVLPRYK